MKNDEKDWLTALAYLADCPPEATTRIEDMLGEMIYLRSLGPELDDDQDGEGPAAPYDDHRPGFCTICDALRVLETETRGV